VQLTLKDKVQDFKNQFRPLLQTMTVWTMHRFFGNDCGKSSWRGNTHLLMVKLKETTPVYPNAPVACSMMIEGKDVDEIRNRELFIQQAIREDEVLVQSGSRGSFTKYDATGYLILIYEDGPHTRRN
jgi:hypothetical protein